MSAQGGTGTARPTVAVAICTFNRHGPLTVLLEALVANAKRIEGRASVGVVIVDDSKDGNARAVVEPFASRFERGLTYRVSGRQNIALARNMGLETALEFADWIAMTDDDCEPAPNWLEALLNVQQKTGCDAVSGVLSRRVPPGSPRWLTEEPFLSAGLFDGIKDGQEAKGAATHNSMVSGQWLREHPQIRFDPNFGVTGGEDPVFYGTAHSAGLRIRFAASAVAYEHEPASRANLSYQLRMYFWLGNSSFITSVRQGVSPLRMAVHGARVLLSGLVRPLARLVSLRNPQLRYGLAVTLRGVGILSGMFGLRIRHK